MKLAYSLFVRPAAGRPAAGRPAAGRPAAGRSAAGRSAAGRSAAGRSAAGRSAAGRWLLVGRHLSQWHEMAFFPATIRAVSYLRDKKTLRTEFREPTVYSSFASVGLFRKILGRCVHVAGFVVPVVQPVAQRPRPQGKRARE